MGVWGPCLYDNDCTADIRDRFQWYLEKGISPNCIKQMIQVEYAKELEDLEDGPLVRLALADQLREVGALDSKNRNEVLKYLLRGGDLDNWSEASTYMYGLHRKEIERLIRVFQISPSKNDMLLNATGPFFSWKVGQVYALCLESQIAFDLGLSGEYLLFYIFEETQKNKKERFPAVWLKLTKGGFLPRSGDEFNQLEFIQIACTAMENRFRPFPNEDTVPLEYRQEYYPDDWGFLPEYSMTISESRNSCPPKSLILLGDFRDVEPPKYNYRRYRSAHGAVWKHLEDFSLLRYRIHNLRQGGMYNEERRPLSQ